MKTAIARALIHDPKNVILDEPTNGLDVMATRAMREFLKRLKREGRCVLFSSHIMQEVAALCDRIVVIAHGKVVCRRITGSIAHPDRRSESRRRLRQTDRFGRRTCRMKAALIVFLKEVRENLRDRRTVINTPVTGPLMAPLIFVLMMQTLVTRELEKAEEAAAAARGGRRVRAESCCGAQAAERRYPGRARGLGACGTRAGGRDVVLRIPENFAALVEKGRTGTSGNCVRRLAARYQWRRGALARDAR